MKSNGRVGGAVENLLFLPSCFLFLFLSRLPSGGLDARDDVTNPTQSAKGDEPNRAGEDKLNERRKDATLHQLAEARNEKAADCCDDISRRALTI